MISRSGFLIFFCAVVTQVSALPGASRFQTSFNGVAKKHGVPLRAAPAKCDGSLCKYDLSPRGHISVSYGDSTKRIDEVSAYFSPDVVGGEDAIGAVNVLIRVFSPELSEQTKRAAVDAILAGATGSRRDGEITLGKRRYVMRPSDGRDIRLYVTSID